MSATGFAVLKPKSFRDNPANVAESVFETA